MADPSTEHVRYVADRMRDQDAEEFLAVSFATSKAELCDNLVSAYAANPAVFCFSADDKTPIAVGALIESRPNVITMMFFATEQFQWPFAMSIARFFRREILPRYREAGIHRFECISIDGYTTTHRWLGILGLKREGGPLRGFGKGGETFHQFSWVADDVR